MLASISHALGKRKINIHNMLNKSKGEMAYTLVDVDSPVPAEALKELCSINGVLAVRYLPVAWLTRHREAAPARSTRSTTSCSRCSSAARASRSRSAR